MAAQGSRPTVAIVGTGISGLSAAWLLSRDYDVTLLEKHDRLGMDAHGIEVEGDDGKPFRLDAPPRAISEEYYFNLMRLYEHAGIEVEKWSWSFSCTVLGRPRAFFRLSDSDPGDEGLFAKTGGFRIPDLAGIMRLFSLRTLRVVYDGWRFYRNVCRDFQDRAARSMTMKQYLERGGYSKAFTEGILLPMFSMVCTCSYAGVENYPAGLLMDYWLTSSTFN
eukprot:g1643.t1